MIQLQNLTKAFGDRVLLDHVTWQITDWERVGRCGPNGAGKTTLLRMMAGLDEPDSGAVLKPASLTVGYLPQDGLTHAGRTVFEEAASAFSALLAMKDEMHALEARLGDDAIPQAEHDAMLARYSDLQDHFRIGDGYSIELKTATVLQGLGFKPSDFDRFTDTFSGGWQMRIALAKLLLGQPNLLLLDEPTNHLDLEARNWLETYLNAYPYAVILVSHDRFFLDAVVTRIADLTLRTLTDYVGNYSDYLVEHHARIDQLRKAKREQDEEVGRVKMFIDRFRYQATKASQVQSRIKMLGGFLFSGDDVYKRVRVLSGAERTRLAVARMLLRPSNTLLLDEPTNHLDLDSKEVLLDALVDYGGTLLFVSHDRYFVERLATKIIEVGNGTAVVYPGTYKEFLWHKEHPIGQDRPGDDPSAQAREGSVRAASANASLEPAPPQGRPQRREGSLPPGAQGPRPPRREENQALRARKKGQHRDRVAAPIENSREERKRADSDARRRSRADQARRARIDDLETRIADCESAIRDIETTMAAPGFYDDRSAAQPIIDRHQALMWTVGDLMHQWEQLQSGSDILAAN